MFFQTNHLDEFFNMAKNKMDQRNVIECVLCILSVVSQNFEKGVLQCQSLLVQMGIYYWHVLTSDGVRFLSLVCWRAGSSARTSGLQCCGAGGSGSDQCAFLSRILF